MIMDAFQRAQRDYARSQGLEFPCAMIVFARKHEGYERIFVADSPDELEALIVDATREKRPLVTVMWLVTAVGCKPKQLRINPANVDLIVPQGDE